VPATTFSNSKQSLLDGAASPPVSRTFGSSHKTSVGLPRIWLRPITAVVGPADQKRADEVLSEEFLKRLESGLKTKIRRYASSFDIQPPFSESAGLVDDDRPSQNLEWGASNAMGFCRHDGPWVSSQSERSQ